MSNEISSRALTTLRAEDHMKSGCTHNGFIRKKGRLERWFGLKRWRQKFMVISRGWLYIFKNELSASPQQTYFLAEYNKMVRFEEGQMRWAFRMLPHDTTVNKFLLFAASSDANRKEWMKALKKEMMLANGVNTRPSSDVSEDEYVYLEREIIQGRPVTADDDSCDSDYNTIDEAIGGGPLSPEPTEHGANGKSPGKPKKPTFKPAPPGESYTEVKKDNKKPKRPVPDLPSKDSEPKPVSPHGPPATNTELYFIRANFEFNGSDRTQVGSIVMSKPEGTYLVRKSRSDDSEVLSINIMGTLKEFKIYCKEGQRYSIDNKQTFVSVEALLRHYTTVFLPGHSVKLRRPYKLASDGYVNDPLTL